MRSVMNTYHQERADTARAAMNKTLPVIAPENWDTLNPEQQATFFATTPVLGDHRPAYWGKPLSLHEAAHAVQAIRPGYGYAYVNETPHRMFAEFRPPNSGQTLAKVKYEDEDEDIDGIN